VQQRAFGLVRNIDLAFAQALDEIVRRDVDQLDRIGAIEDGIRDGFAHPDAGDLRDDVVEALDVLDVHGGIDVDAMAEDFLDVEITLGMAAARRVGVSEFVDQHDLGAQRDDGIEVHFLDGLAAIGHRFAGDDRQPLEQRLGLLASMGFHHADDHIGAVLAFGAGVLEHFIGLADARSGADEYAQLAEPGVLAPRRLQQGVRRRALLEIMPLVRHRGSACLSYRSLRFYPSPSSPSR
jgi:hypothetical protein